VLRLVERSTHGTCRLESKVLAAQLIALTPRAEQDRILAKVDQLLVV
jgi:type I restriction enzyme S subunit